jgi:transcriptional regulator with XRE-family HTH domain
MAKKYPRLASILKKLLFERDIKASDLARAVDLPPPTIHRLITGKSTRPYESSLKPIADYFSIEVSQLLGEEPLSSPDTTGKEKAVQALGTGYIDNIPLIRWNQLPKTTSADLIKNGAFATVMPDTSMEPLIQRNSILIFDPSIKPVDRSYVLVKLHETEAYILRQLLVDADHQYLKPLNPDLSTFKMRLLHKHDEIIACLAEARHNFRPDNNSIISRETVA